MKKKLFVLLMALSLTAGSLVGCGQQASEGGQDTASQTAEGDEKNTESSEQTSAENVEIQFLHGQPEEERVQVIQSIIDDFMADNPGITVTQMPIPEEGFWTKITTLMSGRASGYCRGRN